MKQVHLSFLLIGAISVVLTSCQSSAVPYTQDGNWVYRGDFDAIPRSEAVSFVINDSAYVGMGVDANFIRYNDLWSFDPVTFNYSQLASCPGVARNSAVGFSVNGEGYVATGYDGYNMLSDCWQFDPVGNAWTQKASFIGSGRYDAIAFSVGNYGYVGTGYDGNYKKDFYRYDPSSDSWSASISYPGHTRTQAITFVYNDSAYVVTGNSSGSVVDDFWRFDPNLDVANQWRELRHISNFSPDTYDDGYTTIERSNGVGFVLTNTKSDGGGDRAYITTGVNGALMSQTWAYNFATDLWNQKTPMERGARQGSVGFTVNNQAFVALGLSGNTPISETDQWYPDDPYNQQD
ncbi:MAG TPA: kelch repeat-containing protein [Puia sp.]|nr:kelch repeat-containing protein [Puia sp.]